MARLPLWLLLGLLVTANADVAEQGPLDFELLSSQGPVTVETFRGQVVYLYFGYTHCPDVCPTSLATLAAAFNQLTPSQLARVQGLFVTVDPERDDLERLDAYVHWFHPRIRALTGTAEQIAQAAARFGVEYQKEPLPDSAMGYAMNHTAAIYVITPEGELGYVFPHGTPAEVLAEAARHLLEKAHGPGAEKAGP